MNETTVKELMRLEKKNGILRTSDVVEEAEPESSPLHSHFEWSDDIAGHNYRLWQARTLIAKVRVIYQDKPKDLFYNVKVTSVSGEEEQGYVSINTVVQNENLHTQVLESALKEIERWQEKYKEISELKGLVNTKELEKMKEKVYNN